MWGLPFPFLGFKKKGKNIIYLFHFPQNWGKLREKCPRRDSLPFPVNSFSLKRKRKKRINPHIFPLTSHGFLRAVKVNVSIFLLLSFSGHVLCVGTFGLKLGTCVRLLCFCGGPRAREGPLGAAAESSALFSDSHRFPMAVKPCGQSLISAAAVFPREEIGGGENPTGTGKK